MNNEIEKSAKNWILWGIPSLFLAGSIMHYLYEFSGKCAFIGSLAPVNESIWEHTKMAFVPTLAWWSGYWAKNKKKLNGGRWFSACLASLFTSIWVMPIGYYFYTGVFGDRVLWVDISLLFLAVFLGQILALHILRHAKKTLPAWVCAIAFALIAVIYVIWTFKAPHIPFFRDGITGKYGI